MDLTHGEFVGTPNFMSPEQFGSGPIDARSDIYSLGATLWFALTGLAPHPGSTIEEIRDRQTRDDLRVEQLAARKVRSGDQATALCFGGSGSAARVGSRVDGKAGVLPSTAERRNGQRQLLQST
jgi:serine/threonine protein kinase